MSIKIKNYIKDVLGITALENKIKSLEKTNEEIKDRLFSLRRRCEEVTEDNRLVLRHVNTLNSQFSVVSDLNNPKYEPSVVIVFRRGNEEIVKSYVFHNNTLEHIHRFLEGFGKDNNRIDQPRGFPRPRFRY